MLCFEFEEESYSAKLGLSRLWRLTHLIWKLLAKSLLLPSIKPSLRIVCALVCLTQQALRLLKAQARCGEEILICQYEPPHTVVSPSHLCNAFWPSWIYQLTHTSWALTRSRVLCSVHRIWWWATTGYFSSLLFWILISNLFPLTSTSAPWGWVFVSFAVGSAASTTVPGMQQKPSKYRCLSEVLQWGEYCWRAHGGYV